MTTTQVFFALAGLIVTMILGLAGFLKHYLDAKIDPVRDQVNTLVNYMVLHERKICSLEDGMTNL